jgi:hypothetical protein
MKQLALSAIGVAALVLMFASAPLLTANHQALAYRHYHGHAHYYGGGHRGHGYVHVGKTVKTPRGIYHRGVTVARRY